MILLDTNVISEAMKPDSNPQVRRWLDAQPAEALFLSSVTFAELSYGVSVLPKGNRRQRLTAAIEAVVELFAGRLLAFDAEAARRYGVLAATARALGRSFPTPDGYIAAIAAAREFAVASRDPTAFAAVGLTVIDPWRAAPASA